MWEFDILIGMMPIFRKQIEYSFRFSMCIFSYLNIAWKNQIGLKNAIVSSVVLWAKYINANGYWCCCGTVTQDTTKKEPPFIVRYSNFVFSQ